MSREIRPVALDWEHPVDHERPTYPGGDTRYVPLHSRETLMYALDDPEWVAEGIDPADFMPELAEGTPYGWQMYETVSKGSPVSPVFASKDELAAWLSSPAAGREQVSPEAASAFAADGWAPTFVSAPGGGLISGVASAHWESP